MKALAAFTLILLLGTTTHAKQLPVYNNPDFQNCLKRLGSVVSKFNSQREKNGSGNGFHISHKLLRTEMS